MDDSPKIKKWSKDEAIINIRKYCAYQDRCHQEVRFKLIAHAIYGDLLENILTDLITEGYLDEERFARSYARGKFSLKKWGRLRIIRELKLRQITVYCINAAMEEIHEDEYQYALKEILSKKMKENSQLTMYESKYKAMQYAQSRGFEYDAIQNAFLDLCLDNVKQ